MPGWGSCPICSALLPLLWYQMYSTAPTYCHILQVHLGLPSTPLCFPMMRQDSDTGTLWLVRPLILDVSPQVPVYSHCVAPQTSCKPTGQAPTSALLGGPWALPGTSDTLGCPTQDPLDPSHVGLMDLVPTPQAGLRTEARWLGPTGSPRPGQVSFDLDARLVSWKGLLEK